MGHANDLCLSATGEINPSHTCHPVCFMPGGQLPKEEEQIGRRKNRSHTCYVVIDSCYMSIPVLRGKRWVMFSHQQRAAEGFRADVSLRGRSQSSVWDSQRIVFIYMSPHKCPLNLPRFDLKWLNELQRLCLLPMMASPRSCHGEILVCFCQLLPISPQL